METTQGSHIGYTAVKVSQAGNGYSLFRYDAVPVSTNDDVAITTVQSKCVCDPSAIPNYPPAPLQHDFRRGELLYEAQADNSGNILLERFYDTEYTINSASAPGQVSFSFSTSTTPYTHYTFYDIKTGRKSKTSVTEKNYSNGNLLSSTTETFYESSFHNQPTRVVKVNSVGKTSETKMKYLFDLRTSWLDPDCFGALKKNDFTGFFNALYNSSYLPVPSNETPPVPLGSSFKREFENCGAAPGGYPKPCYITLMNNFMKYLCSPTTGRLSYINCQLSNKTISKANFAAAKANANPEFVGPRNFFQQCGRID
jgi:hypothetical protein